MSGIDASSTNLGYRSIHKKLRHNSIKKYRETVRLCLKTIDQESVKTRKADKVKRGVYLSQGQNFIWQLEQLEVVGAFKMLLWPVCSSILEESIRTPPLDIQVFYSEALRIINK